MMYESLESRRLLAGDELLAPAARLIGHDRLLADFPALTGIGQSVAVIDTGIDYMHPLLGGGFGPGFKVIGGYDFVDNDPDPLDTDGHGTSVAGLIAAEEFIRDGVRYRSLAPESGLIALRISKDTASTPNSRIEQALQWVIDKRVTYNITAVNISFGSGHFEREPADAAFATELAELRELGVFVAAASGNGGVNDAPGIDYPAADNNAVSVGSVDEFDTIAESSERGRLLDLLAPGENLLAPSVNNSEKIVRGTSFATPLVTAAAVLVQAANPALSPAEILSVLQASGKDNFDGDDEFGATTSMRFSRLDVHAAASLAFARAPADPGADPNFTTARTNAIAIDQHGVMHAAWYDAAARTLMHATRSPSEQWSAPLRVDSDPIDSGQFLSLALDSAGRPGIAYFDGTNGDLRYARWTAAAFTIDTIDARQSVGLYPSTQFNFDNQPVVAYYHRSKGDLRLARFDGNWHIDDIDRDANDRGRSVSLAINSIGRLAAAYEDSTTGKLKFARQTAVNWFTGTIDDSTAGVSFISLAFGPADKLAVSYYDAAPADLKFASEGQDPSRFSTVTVARKGAVGLYSQLSLDSEGAASILYYSRKDDALLLASGTISRFVARKMHATGGKFAARTINPLDQSIAYTWLDNSTKSLTFESFVA